MKLNCTVGKRYIHNNVKIRNVHLLSRYCRRKAGTAYVSNIASLPQCGLTGESILLAKIKGHSSGITDLVIINDSGERSIWHCF